MTKTVAYYSIEFISAVKSLTGQAQGTIFTKLHFFITYKLSGKAGVLHYTGLEKLARDKQSSLLGQAHL
jgi:hypothetical protein